MEKLKNKRVLLLGCGDIGSKVALALQAEDREVLAVRRNVALLPAGLPALALDYTDAIQTRNLAAYAGSTVVMTPVPGDRSAAGYRRSYPEAVSNLLRVWENSPPQQILFVSSTRVYGDRGGDWVDEDASLLPEGEAGASIAAAERLLLDSSHAVTLVRFAGIYGRSPSHLLQRIQSGRICQRVPVRYGNRIHRDDCVGFLLHLLRMQAQGLALEKIYLGVDDAPVSQFEVETWLAQRMGVTPQPVLPSAALQRQSPAANKRCRNRRLHASGYQLRYPDYRSGYGALL